MSDDLYGWGDDLYGWGVGGIFGKTCQDAVEVLDEIECGPPGVLNRLGAEDEVRRRRAQKAQRASMLIVERFIDELPDLRDRLLDRFGPTGLRGKILNRLCPGQDPFTMYPGTVREALSVRLRDSIRNTAFDVTAEVFLRAYNRDIRRAQAAVRLDAFSAEAWAEAQSRKVLTAPSAAAAAVVSRAQALAARLRHVANAVSEPLDEPKAETADPAPDPGRRVRVEPV